MTGQPSRWFQLSGREVRVLLVAAAIIILVFSFLGIRRRLGGTDQFRVDNAVEMLERPARIDINTAAGYELELLPGIGPKTAEAVITDRTKGGLYTSLEDLKRVNGIGPKTVERIRPYVMCRPPESQ